MVLHIKDGNSLVLHSSNISLCNEPLSNKYLWFLDFHYFLPSTFTSLVLVPYTSQINEVQFVLKNHCQIFSFLNPPPIKIKMKIEYLDITIFYLTNINTHFYIVTNYTFFILILIFIFIFIFFFLIYFYIIIFYIM